MERVLDTEGDPEGRFEADPTKLSLLCGVGVLGEEAAAEREAALAEGKVEGEKESMDPRVLSVEKVLKAETEVVTESLAKAVDTVVREDAAACVTVTVPDGEGNTLTLGMGLKEADSEDDTEMVA